MRRFADKSEFKPFSAPLAMKTPEKSM